MNYKSGLTIIIVSSLVFLSCGNMSDELNGVWRGDKSNKLIVIDFKSDNPYIKVDEEKYTIIKYDVVSNNTAVVVKVRRGTWQDIWTFRASWEKYYNAYSFFWKRSDGFEDKLIYIRRL